MSSGGSKGSNDAVRYQREQENLRQARIRDGMSRLDNVFGQFDDNFYNQRRDAYVNFATPQLQDQFKQQRDGLTFALARGGNLASSLSANRSADLNKDFSLQQQAIVDTGRDYANAARSDVQQQKANLVSLLQASADPDAAANLAQTQATALSQRPAHNPLGQVLQNAAAGIGAYVDGRNTQQIINQAGGQPYAKAANSKGSGRVTGR